MVEGSNAYSGIKVNNKGLAQRDKYVDVCVYVTLLCNLLILLGNPLKNSFLVSLGTRVMILFVIALAIVSVVNGIQKKPTPAVDALFAVLIIFTALAFFLSCTPNLYSNFVSYMCFLMLPSYAVIYRNADNVKRLKETVYWANAVYTAVFIGLYFSEYSHIFYGEYGIKNIDDLTLGYNNANEAAIYLLVALIIMLSAFEYTQKKLLKIGSFVLSCVLFYMVYETHSRICLIIAGLVAIIKITKLAKKMGKGLQTLIVVFPVILAVLMLAFPEWFLDIKIMGEVADNGRYHLYKQFLEQLNFSSVFMGAFSSYPGANLHNSYISIFAMFGLPTLVVYMMFLKSVLNNYYEGLQTNGSHIAFLGFLLLIFHGIAEAAVFVSGSVYAGLTGLLFILMLPEKESAEL